MLKITTLLILAIFACSLFELCEIVRAPDNKTDCCDTACHTLCCSAAGHTSIVQNQPSLIPQSIITAFVSVDKRPYAHLFVHTIKYPPKAAC